ncbi:MAG: hypothetical protein DWQ19_00990, partial [Crenarchaeota archaeon]
METKAIAVALVSIILISSFSFAFATSVSIYSNIPNDEITFSQIKTTNTNEKISKHYSVNLFDGISVKQFNGKKLPVPDDVRNEGKIYSVNLFDGIKTSSEKKTEGIITKIHNGNERLAIWERIFPLERFKNPKSIYKTIQNDYGLHVIQTDENDSDDKKLEFLDDESKK